MDWPSLSIVIPTHNGRGHLARCLPAVRRHAPAGTQVIVVDDASTDGTRAWLRTQHPWVELRTLPENRGFCHAVNAGLAAARGEVVELLNDDTEVCPGWAEAALGHFADPTVGSVAPLVLCMDRPGVIDSAGQEYHLCGWARNRGHGEPVGPAYLSAGEVFGPSGSSGFYRRSALARVGGLLPEYGAYYEDVDLSFRLRWAGYRCVYEPAARVFHQGSASYGRQPERVVQLIARNEELVFWTNLRLGELLLGLLPHAGFQLIRTVRKALAGQLGPFLRGKREALGLLRWVLRQRRELRRLARTGGRPVRLAISTSPRVLRLGWSWMARRRSA
jgi:GT2 family glycosyltransferase